MKPRSIYATVAGPIFGFSLPAFFIVGLSIVAKVTPSLLPTWKRIELYLGPNGVLYAGVAGVLLLIAAFALSFQDQKIFRQKMGARTESEKWLLALSAIYVELSEVLKNNDIESFYRIDMTRAWYMFIAHIFTRMGLQKNWGITDRTSALETLHQLLVKVQNGKEKPSIAWDGVRYAHVARTACISGYLTPDETWEELKKIGPLLQKTFSSWKELNENFISGRIMWGGLSHDLETIKKSRDRLIADPKSPCNTLPWTLKLEY